MLVSNWLKIMRDNGWTFSRMGDREKDTCVLESEILI